MRDFATLGRHLQARQVQLLAAVRQGLDDVAQELDTALRQELAAEPTLQASVQHEVQGLEAVVGSTSTALLQRELGDGGQAPLPLLAQVASQTDVEKIMTAALGRLPAQQP